MKELKEFKNGEYYTNATLEELTNNKSLDGLKIFSVDQKNKTITIYKIQNVSMKEHDSEWRVTYAELNISNMECNLNCFNCDFCKELEKMEEDGNADIHFRDSYLKAIESVMTDYIISCDGTKWKF